MALKIFEDHEAKCEYCLHLCEQGETLFCLRKRNVPLKPCRSFEYDPLKRVPRQEARLPEYRPEDFAGFDSSTEE